MLLIISYCLHTKKTNAQNIDKPNDRIIIHDVCSYRHANNKCNMIGNIINLATEASVCNSVVCCGGTLTVIQQKMDK